MYDLVLRGGDVIDGTGAPGYTADVAILDGRICEIGRIHANQAREVVDVNGLIVAPGFIDSHSHDDRYVLLEPDVPAKVTQGVTTTVTGNCGISIAPGLHGRSPPPPLDILGDSAAYQFTTFSEYLEAIDASPPSVNVYPLLGLTTLRVRELEHIERSATAAEIERMRDECDAALVAGALGVSIGTFYPPAAAADNREIASVARGLREIGGVLAVHLRDEADGIIESLDEAYALSKALGSRLVLSHHKVAGVKNHGRAAETLRSITSASNAIGIGFDVYPYAASSTMLRAKNVAISAKTVVTWSQGLPNYAGWEINAIAADLGCGIADAIARLAPAGATYHSMSQDDVDAIVCDSGSMIGSDGLPHDRCPHPRLWGTFPRIFRLYVRERPLLTLAQAIRKMTVLPAERFGIADRGRIGCGMRADVCVFDANGIADRATFELPTQPAIGIRHVLCNGQFVLRDAAPTGVRPGKRITPLECTLRRRT